MKQARYITDITYHPTPHGKKAPTSIHLSTDELAQLEALGLTISDTETTGRPPQDLGLTELASQKAVRDAQGHLRHLSFRVNILPFRPLYQDYLGACKAARKRGEPPPPYDRRKYEYEIDPKALAVTGTRFIRQPLNGPITAMEINGKRIKAYPFYEVMEDFLTFTNHGVKDCYYNMPFDATVLAGQISDVRAHALAQSLTAAEIDQRFGHTPLDHDRYEAMHQFANKGYSLLRTSERTEYLRLLKPLVEVPDAYRNSATYRCLLLNYLAVQGFGPSNRLDDAYRNLVDANFTERGDHAAEEDVTMAARVALRIARQQEGTIPTVQGLYAKLARAVSPTAKVESLPPRPRDDGTLVHGDLLLHMGRQSDRLSPEATRFWEFLVGFSQVRRNNGRLPEHVLEKHADGAWGAHALLNAERKQPLTLNLLKKVIFHEQLRHSPVIDRLVTHKSTGTVVDVVMRRQPGQSEATTIRNVPLGAVRANLAFLNAHPTEADAWLRLIAELKHDDRSDKRVGMILLRPREDASVILALQGHDKRFGECTVYIPPGEAIGDAQVRAAIRAEAQKMLRIGAMPHAGGVTPQELDEYLAEEHGNETPDESSPLPLLDVDLDHRGEQLIYTVPEAVFSMMASQLHQSPARLLHQRRLTTADGQGIALRRIRQQEHGKKETYVRITGTFDALHAYTLREGEQAHGERFSAILKNACWLYEQFDRLPGNYGLHLKGQMLESHQQQGVDVEALGLLARTGIPFKAYGDRIRVDAGQLMPEAFHYSLTLRRQQLGRNQERREGKLDGTYAPPAHLPALQRLLLAHPHCALEINERGESWLVDGSRTPQGQRMHYALDLAENNPRLIMKGRHLRAEESQLGDAASWRLEMTSQDNAILSVRSTAMLALISNQTGLAFPQPDEVTHYTIPAAQVAAVHAAAQKASSFLRTLAHSTGSQRLPIAHIDSLYNGKTVLELPKLDCMRNPHVFTGMLRLHHTLTKGTEHKGAATLAKHLRSISEADERLSDLHMLAAHAADHLPGIAQTVTGLDSILDAFTGSETLNPQKALDHERYMLCQLRHELHSSGASLRIDAITRQRYLTAIEPMQARFSNIAFGTEHFTEHLRMLRKGLASYPGTQRTAVRDLIGQSLASAMDSEAIQLAYHPDTFHANMNAYTEHVQALLQRDQPELDDEKRERQQKGAERTMRSYAEHALIRCLYRLTNDPDSVTFLVIDELMTRAGWHYSTPQKQVLMQLYQYGPAEIGLTLAAQFPAGKDKRRWAATQLLEQYDLIARHEHIPEMLAHVQENHPELALQIEHGLRSAYLTRGKRYLLVAQEFAGPRQSAYLDAAESCFKKAGLDANGIAHEHQLARQPKSETTRQTARDAILYATEQDPGNKDDAIRRVIDQPAMEERYRTLLVAREHKLFRNALLPVITALDPYYEEKQLRELFASIDRFRKEAHDYVVSKPHYLRDLGALIDIGYQQEPTIHAAINGTPPAQRDTLQQRRIHEQDMPEMQGIRSDTLATIREAMATQNTAMVDHANAHLKHHQIEATAIENRLYLPPKALEAMFEAWSKHATQVLPLPSHLQPWQARVASRLMEGISPTVQEVRGAPAKRGVHCWLTLANDMHERNRQWAGFEMALFGTGIKIPTMPDHGGTHHFILRDYVRSIERGQKAFVTLDSRSHFAQRMRLYFQRDDVLGGIEDLEKALRHSRGQGVHGLRQQLQAMGYNTQDAERTAPSPGTYRRG